MTISPLRRLAALSRSSSPAVTTGRWEATAVPSAQPGPGGPDAPRIIATSSTETVAIAGDCLLVVLAGTLSANGVMAVQRGCEQLAAVHARFGYLSVVEERRLVGMSVAARDRMAEVVKKYSARYRCAAFLVEGSGFRATAVRSVLTAIHMASRAGHPMRAFSNRDAALAWYEEKFPEGALRGDALALALERVRLQHRQRRSEG